MSAVLQEFDRLHRSYHAWQPSELTALNAALAPVMAERGLLFVGIDVIGDRLTEINVTSPTCMVEIRQQSGFDAASAFITAIEHACGLA